MMGSDWFVLLMIGFAQRKWQYLGLFVSHEPCGTSCPVCGVLVEIESDTDNTTLGKLICCLHHYGASCFVSHLQLQIQAQGRIVSTTICQTVI